MNVQTTQIELDAAEAPLVLAVDVGSSSARAGLVDARGRRVTGSLAHAEYQLDTTPDGGATLDPPRLAGDIEGLIDGAVRFAAPRRADLAGLAFSTFWHSLMGIGATGVPSTPLYTWADTRSTAYAAALARTLDPAAYHARTGARLHPSYWPAKLAWIRAERRDEWRATARWLSLGDYLFLRWFGRATCSTSIASATGLFDQARQTWDTATLGALGLDVENLSPVDDAPADRLLPPFASRWPDLAAVPWFPALGDGACSNVGAGAVGADRLALVVGTTGAMRLLWEGPAIPPPPGLWLYRLDRRRVLLGGALSEGATCITGWPSASSYRRPRRCPPRSPRSHLTVTG